MRASVGISALDYILTAYPHSLPGTEEAATQTAMTYSKDTTGNQRLS